MDDRGNIKHFESEELARREGYNHLLSQEQYDQLINVVQEERVELYLFNKFHADELNRRKVDPIEKSRYLLALKWAANYYKQNGEKQ
jgi:hypothetical protein